MGLYLRLKLSETPAFEQKDSSEEEGGQGIGAQVKETFARHPRALLVCSGLVIAFNVADYMLLTYMPTYLSENLRFDHTLGLLIVLVVMVVMMASQRRSPQRGAPSIARRPDHFGGGKASQGQRP